MPAMSLEQIRKTVDQLQNEYHIKSKPRPLGGKDFVSAVRTHLWFLSLGLVSGLFFAGIPAMMHSWSDTRPVLAFVLGLFEHLGIGLIVAALAVVAYEWVSEARRAQIHSFALVNLLTLAAEDRLESAHKMLLGDSSDFFEPLREFASHAASLVDKKSWNWASVPYLQFLGEVAGAMNKNATNIAKLAADLQQPNGATGKFDLVFPDPSKLIDSLLMKLLLALPASSKYCAVSNALIWMDLTEFRKAHQTAINAGVTIERVFIIFQKVDDIIADADAISTIYRHYQLSQEWGRGPNDARYEMRFVTADDYERKAPRLAEKRHFGVFRPAPGSGTPVAFDVKDDKLSEFEIMGVGSSSPFIRDFDILWDQCGETNDAILRYILRAERMRRMDSGSYSALSTFENWADERLKALHDDSMEAAGRGVHIRRIFVRNDELNEVMFPILMEHAESRRKHRNYEWRLCAASRVPPALTGRLPLPYGIFEDRGKSGGTKQVLYEVYSGNTKQPFELTGPEAEEMLRSFTRFWDHLDSSHYDDLVDRFGVKQAAELTS